MNTVLKATIAAVIAINMASGAIALDFTKGTVKKLDAKAKKVTIIHDELKNLDMPPMTMVFHIKDEGMVEKLKEGAQIEFVAERVDGKLVVVDLK